MSTDRFKDAQNNIYIATNYRTERNVEPRVTVSEAVCRFLADIEFPIERPNPEYGITDYIPAKIGENLFYWLTSNANTAHDEILTTRVTVASEGVPVLFNASRGRNYSEQPAVVAVTVESTPTRRAMDVARELWSLFASNVKFTAQRKMFDADGACVGYKDDLVVQRAFPSTEPQLVQVNEDGAASVVFRLAINIARTTE